MLKIYQLEQGSTVQGVYIRDGGRVKFREIQFFSQLLTFHESSRLGCGCSVRTVASVAVHADVSAQVRVRE